MHYISWSTINKFFIFPIKPVFIGRDGKIVDTGFVNVFSCFEIFIVFWPGKNPKFIPIQNLGPGIVPIGVMVAKCMIHRLMKN